MSRRLIIILAILGVGTAIWVAIQQRQVHRPGTALSGSAESSPSLHSTPATPPELAQIDTTVFSKTDINAEVQRRDRQDKHWEWKTPIRFYGKIIDERGTPITDANIHFQWTDLSGRGTSESDAKSDGSGLFSLTDVAGKRLLVRVTKPGFYSSDPRNQSSFEYANPFEEIYHRPSRGNPVVFYLRRHGNAADLLIKSAEIVLPGDGSAARVNLESGKSDPGGELEVQAWKPWPPRPMSPAYDWKVVFTLAGGGFVESGEDFAFEAPEEGYKEQYVIDMVARQDTQWKVSAERTLYFVTSQPKRYGRLSIRTDGNSRYVFLDYVINRSGGRNVESAEGRK